MPDHQQQRAPLLFLTGLWDKNGTLSGGIDLNYTNREGIVLGDELLALIDQARTENKRIRLVIFKNTRGGGGPDYRANVQLDTWERPQQGAQSDVPGETPEWVSDSPFKGAPPTTGRPPARRR